MPHLIFLLNSGQYSRCKTGAHVRHARIMRTDAGKSDKPPVLLSEKEEVWTVLSSNRITNVYVQAKPFTTINSTKV